MTTLLLPGICELLVLGSVFFWMKNLPVIFLRGVSFQGKAPNILENSHGNQKIEILDHDFPFQLTFSSREFSGVFAGSKSDMADPTVSLPTHLEGGQGLGPSCFCECAHN